MSYFFFSMSSKQTRKNIGVCIIQAVSERAAQSKLEETKLLPAGADDIKIWRLDEKEFKAQGLEVDKFYSREQVKKMNFSSI